MELRCSHCESPIERQAKGYKRKSLLTLIDIKSAEKLFPGLNPREAFLCFSCVRQVYQKTKKNGKRRVFVDPNPPSCAAPSTRPASSIPGEPPPLKKLKKRLKTQMNEHDYATQDQEPGSRRPPPARRLRRGPVSQVSGFLRKRNFSSALNRLLQETGFREALIKVCGKIISNERKQMVNDLEGPFRKPFSPENLSAFSWDQTTSWAEGKAPLTVACLRSMFPPAKKIQKLTVNYSPGNKPRRMTEEEVKQMLERRICLVLSVSLYTSSLRSCFLQTAFSVEMLRQRCPVTIFSVTNSLGLSMSKTTARIHVRKLAEEHERTVKRWRDEIQTTRATQYCSEDSKKAAAYTFSWGKVRVPSVSRSDSTERGYSFVTWAFRFAHQVRVNFRNLHGPPIKAVEVSPYSILPTKETYESLRRRMKTLVMRIIADNLTALKGPRGRVERHIPHKYSSLMKEQSTTVSLGAVIPNLTEESVSAAFGLKDFIPEVSGTPHHVLCCGDVLSTERKEQSNKTQNNETPKQNPELRFDGLVEAPPEFQKEHLFHEEMIKMLLSEKSENARGTLHHIVSLFHFKTFNNTAKDYFLNIWDFITFVTSAYVTLFAVTACGLDSVDQRPSDFPPQASAQMDWLRDLALRLVDLVWMPPSQEDINMAAAAAAAGQSDGEKRNIFPFCFCREEKPGERLVRCCSNLCPRIWFHESCVQTRTLSDQDQDRFCGPDCGSDGTYAYCRCKERRGGQMVQCGLMERCRRHEWYHRACLTDAQQSNNQHTPWFCSSSCSMGAGGEEDFLLNYTKAVLWEGLNHLARRDAIREGDGDAMTDFWRTDMVLLWSRKHMQLFNSSHQLITGIEGFYPERVRQDMKWNRVLNLQGTSGGNVSLDLLTELMINEFKGGIEFGKGSFTSQQVEQSAQLAGDQANHLDRLFFTGGNPLNLSSCLHRLTNSSSSSCKRAADVSRFVDEFKKDELFSFKPGRKHAGFEKFIYPRRVRNPKKMGRSVRSLSEELDRRRDNIL
ncbi:hypothetical protein CgunFtcFv8_012249 [Champsocephalus gunnari]|uniref:Zinc finger PHD-type domain-containing protein n=1 Tax=Champsocephalus gunnari TaxID=52237 RepID=A0AAN8D728_CHAGU|nr:hypothetical protein CgunFtcFv8_012249 [Champsocephalus gunnari]